MRTRTSLYSVLGVLGGVLLATVVFLVACAGPAPSAAGPDPGTSRSAEPDPAVTAAPPAGGGGGGGGWTKPHPPPHHSTKPTPPKPTHTTTPPPTHTTTPPRPPVNPPAQPPLLGPPSADGQTFTMAFSSLEAKDGQLSRTAKSTVPITGDTSGAVIEFAVQGHAITHPATSARLSMTACGASSGRSFHTGFDDSYVFTMAVPLRGKHSCAITMTVSWKLDKDVRGTDAYLNIATLDARFL